MTMDWDVEARAKVVRARASLVLDHPFFGHLALRLKPVADPTCETAWSDGKTLAYNPLYVRMLPSEKLKGLMGHVVMHPACRHHLRRNGRDPKRWNMACDYAINWILLEAGLSLPDGYLEDPALRGKTAEEIYARLCADASAGATADQARPSEKQTGTEGAETDAAEFVSRPGSGNRPNEEQEEQAAPAGKTGVDADEQDVRQSDHDDPGRSGEVRDAPPSEEGASESGDGQTEENLWRINLAQAADCARSMGDLPGGLLRLIDNLLSPTLDWRLLLGRFIQAAARCDFSWTPPNRRYLHQGLYLPSMRSDDLPEAVVVLDTSGSVSAGELDRFAGELSAILETCVSTVHLLYCDMQVVRAETLDRQDLPLRLEAAGGGGTDFRPAFAWVERQGLMPLCLIYLTDMACNRFPPEPGYPVLWVHTGSEAQTPPFGEAIRLD
jgi:predicted metal-dependent peptidase